MQKCLNCNEPAHYTVKNVGASTQYFCVDHLPRFINPTKLLDHVSLYKPELPPITSVVENPVVEEKTTAKPKKKATVKSEPVVEVAAVEEPVVEEVVVETPSEE